MAKKNILYIQFQLGDLADVEKWALERSTGDIARYTFCNHLDIDLENLDIVHNFDQVILGTAPFDFPEEVSPKVVELVDHIRELHFPCLGIDFGHLILADLFGFEVARDPGKAEINQIKHLKVHSIHSEITPYIDIDLLDENAPDENHFSAYLNHTDSVTKGDPYLSLISSDTNEFEAIEFSKRIYGFQFIPFLDDVTYRWWVATFPEFWQNLHGFWRMEKYRKNRILSAMIDFYYTYLTLDKKYKAEYLQMKTYIKDSWQDLSAARSMLRSFITKVSYK